MCKLAENREKPSVSQDRGPGAHLSAPPQLAALLPCGSTLTWVLARDTPPVPYTAWPWLWPLLKLIEQLWVGNSWS